MSKRQPVTFGLLIAFALLFSQSSAGVQASWPIAQGPAQAKAASEATAPADKIVFVRPQPEIGANANVWIMNADGSSQTQLTNMAGDERLPALSPNGSRIAFLSLQNNQPRLWVMGADGRSQTQIPFSGDAGIPAWSPDGNQIAMQADGGQWWEVWVLNADGSNPQRLTNFTEAAGSPSWSPDGQKLVFLNEPVARFHNLYTINRDGTGQSLLTSANASGYSLHRPSWSPDGASIAAIRYPAGSFGPYDLWLMNADGTGGTTLVQSVDSYILNRISWSRDGNWLVFSKGGKVWRIRRDGTQLTQIITNDGWEPDTSSTTFVSSRGDAIAFVRPQPGAGNNADIWIMSADSTNQSQLTTYTGEDRFPSISPDGSRVAYASSRNGQGQLWIMSSDGSDPTPIPLAGNTMRLSWSPDGNRIAFGNDSSDWWEIWIVNADGTNARRLTTTTGASGEPSWSPDGQHIIFNSEPSPRVYDLFKINSDGTGQALFMAASSTGYSNLMAAWSPDGNEIATIRFPAGSTSSPYVIWLMNADGSNGRALVQDVEHPHLNRIDWSADGQWLVFAKGGQIWRVNRDGTGLAQITSNSGWEPSMGRAATTINPCVADMVIVLDRSSSMDDNNKLSDAIAAITTFITDANAPPEQVGLISFAATAAVNQPLTTDKTAVIAAAQVLTTSSGTRMDLGLQQARLELASPRHDPSHKKVIILLGDGQQHPAGNDPVLAEADAAKADGATIFTIGLGPGADAALLQQIASSPAYYYFAPTGTDLANIYDQISTVLACSDIGGQVFFDHNADGLYTAGSDVPLANTTVRLSGPVLSQTVSSSAGNTNYLFANLPPATYTVSLDLTSVPTGYVPTTVVTRAVGLTSAADSLNNDFGVGPDPNAPCLSGPLIYTNRFDGLPGPLWSTAVTSTTPSNRSFHGEFGNHTETLFLGGLPQHTSLTVCFDLFLIRSWDGNTILNEANELVGPDHFELRLQGSAAPLLRTTFSNWANQRQSYPGTFPGGDYASRTGAKENDTLGYTYASIRKDSVYRVQVTFPHSATVAVLDFSASGLQPLADESWGLDNVEVKANYDVQTYYTYLPASMRHWATGVVGRVTQNGAPVGGVPLDLRFYNGSAWSTRASTTTTSDGGYVFSGVPSLGAGQRYYVRYQNTSLVSGRLWIWGTAHITTYTAGTRLELNGFDIADIALLWPYDEDGVSLPTVFQWAPRSATPTDSYEFNLFDPDDGNPYFYTNPPLGYVSNYSLSSLPPGFGTYTWYLWDVWVYSPDGGTGISLWGRWVYFTSSGFSGATSRDMAAPNEVLRWDEVLEGQR